MSLVLIGLDTELGSYICCRFTRRLYQHPNKEPPAPSLTLRAVRN